MYLKEKNVRTWTNFIWLRTQPSCELFWKPLGPSITDIFSHDSLMLHTWQNNYTVESSNALKFKGNWTTGHTDILVLRKEFRSNGRKIHRHHQTKSTVQPSVTDGRPSSTTQIPITMLIQSRYYPAFERRGRSERIQDRSSVCPSLRFSSRIAGRILVKFGIDVMLLEATLNP
jgi:hypothetical protein